MDRLEIFERDGFRCVCGKSVYAYGTPQLAHRVPQRKHFLKRYGKEVIHHPMNLVSTCSLECNASVSIGGKPLEIAELVEKIKQELHREKSKVRK